MSSLLEIIFSVFGYVIAGYVINFAGYGKEITYKKSRIGNSLSDLAAENVLKHSEFPARIVDFFPFLEV